MRLAPLTNVTDDSRTMLRDELAPRRPITPQARTNDVSVISALPFTLYLIVVSSGTPGPRAGLGCSETVDWTGRTTSAQRNGGFAGSSLLDGNYLSTRVLGAPDTQESPPIGPPSENPGGGLFGNDAGASAQGDRGLTGSNLFGAGNDRDDSGRLF